MGFARQPQPSSGVWTAPSGFLLYFPLPAFVFPFSPLPSTILGRLLWGLGICFPLPLLSFFPTTSGLFCSGFEQGCSGSIWIFLPALSRPSCASSLAISMECLWAEIPVECWKRLETGFLSSIPHFQSISSPWDPHPMALEKQILELQSFVFSMQEKLQTILVF